MKTHKKRLKKRQQKMQQQIGQVPQLTIEQALQNVSTAVASVPADLNTHMTLQASLGVIKQELEQGTAATAKQAVLETENAQLKEQLEALRIKLEQPTTGEEGGKREEQSS